MRSFVQSLFDIHAPRQPHAVTCQLSVSAFVFVYGIFRFFGHVAFSEYMYSLNMEMSRLTRDGTAEPVSRDQIVRHARGQWDIHFLCSADHEQDRQPYPVDPYSAICHVMTLHTYIYTLVVSS